VGFGKIATRFGVGTGTAKRHRGEGGVGVYKMDRRTLSKDVTRRERLGGETLRRADALYCLQQRDCDASRALV
jgi:hypothetical protein